MGKLDFYKFVDMCNYCDFSKQRAKIGDKLYNGYLYRLCGYKNGTTLDDLKKYSNVKIYNGHCEYAPELKYTRVFIAHSISKAKNVKNII